MIEHSYQRMEIGKWGEIKLKNELTQLLIQFLLS